MKRQALQTPLSVGVAIESFFDGGAEMFAIRLANKLAESQQVYFIELYPFKTVAKRQLRLLDRENIKLIQPGHGGLPTWLNKKRKGTGKLARAFDAAYYRLIRSEVKSFIRNNNIGVVNSHAWDSDVFFASLKKELNFKLVSSFHGHYEFLADKRANFQGKTINAFAGIDEVVYTSPTHEQTLNYYSVPAVKRHKIFYGIEMSPPVNITQLRKGDVLKIVMVARGIKEKGWKEAILAVLQLLEKYPGQLHLTLVGEGEYLESLQLKYRHAAISFLGYRKDVRQITAAAHIGILPTYYVAESMPNTIIEYLACGKPVITTNVGAIPEMISFNDQFAGACISLTDDKVNVDCLSARIEQYLMDPSLVAKQSAIAIKAAEKFSMEKCTENYSTVFRNILKLQGTVK